MDSLHNVVNSPQVIGQPSKEDLSKLRFPMSNTSETGLRRIGVNDTKKRTVYINPTHDNSFHQTPNQVTRHRDISRVEPQNALSMANQQSRSVPCDKQQTSWPSLAFKRDQSIEEAPKTSSKPISYVEKLTATPVFRSLESTGQSAQVKVRNEHGRLESHIRINEAIQRGDWHPPLLEELKLKPKCHFSQKVNTYLKYLQNVLKGVTEPIEACIRVTSCINYLQEMLRPDENDNFNLLRLKFESIYKLTLHPCIVEIRKQAKPGLAKEYFEVLHQAINIFHFHPFHRKAPSDEVRAEIRNTLTTMIQSELDYLSYAAKLSNRCDNHWAITRLQWTLGEGGPARRFDFLRPDKRKQYLANVASIEKEQSQASVALQDRASVPEKIHLNTQEIDSIIASGYLEKAADFLSAHRGKFHMQERLLCQILKYELDKVLETFTQEKNRENDLSLLAALYSFRKTFRRFIPINYFLNKDTQSLLSAVVVRVLSSHITIITPPDRKLKIERMIQELINNTTMTDQCISLWRKFQHGEIVLEDSLEGMTSYDAFQALIRISRRLSSEPAVDNDFLIAAQEIRVWALNEQTVRKMNDGIRLSKMLAALKHKLYLHFFHHIYKDGSMRKPRTLTEYNKVISKMDCHRKNCIENQKLLYLLKDDKQRKSWQLIACQAWGQYICNLRKKIFRSECISDQDISNLLLLKGISPDIDLGFTRVDFKKLAIDIFNSAVKTPHLVQISHDRLQALSGWVLALLDTEPKDIPAAMKRNEEVKTSISAYRTRYHQQVLAAPPPPPLLHLSQSLNLKHKKPEYKSSTVYKNKILKQPPKPQKYLALRLQNV
ncbi:hypothetical protein [Endozoicomonas atrinae]|uniref:hypothetical protein n=1 Tax=Endozoicomonas atrinae TaxID=1333660 RepID=UPI0008270630|nr:hypothetical protein [Endozoicomonas atrinae]